MHTLNNMARQYCHIYNSLEVMLLFYSTCLVIYQLLNFLTLIVKQFCGSVLYILFIHATESMTKHEIINIETISESL